jgi:hypothetical protein
MENAGIKIWNAIVNNGDCSNKIWDAEAKIGNASKYYFGMQLQLPGMKYKRIGNAAIKIWNADMQQNNVLE